MCKVNLICCIEFIYKFILHFDSTFIEIKNLKA